MTPICPQTTCPYFGTKVFVIKNGYFYRQCESRKIARFRCKHCKKSFSHATGTLEFGQRKRRINSKLRDLLSSSISMRRAAFLLGVSRTTVDRKLIYLAKKARLSQSKFLESIKGTVTELQLDDLISCEHTKLKPLTISLAVDKKRRFLLGARVGSIAAFGHLAELSRRKYGRRKNEHQKTLTELFELISPSLTGDLVIESDEHKLYRPMINSFTPRALHLQYKGGRGCVAGQGELKKLAFDPLFTLNHTCAMLRANINRFTRRTWCTTKDPARLQMHIDIFTDFYNQKYLARFGKIRS